MEIKMVNEIVEDVVENETATVGKVHVENKERTKGNVLDVAPGCMAIDLPCGYVKDDEAHYRAIVKEMTGREEDILAGKGTTVAKLNAIISNCLVSLGAIEDRNILRQAVENMTAQDREAIFIAIRRISFGEFYDAKVSCPKCKTELHKSFDLKEIEIIAMPDRMKREYIAELPSGKIVGWHVMNQVDENWITEQKKKKDDVMTLGLLARVDSINDAPINRIKDYKSATIALKSMSARDRIALRAEFEAKEGNVNREVIMDCEECGHEWSTDLDIAQRNFFFPSGTLSP